MSEQNQYKPKFSREEDIWDDSVWQTGSTQPPKNRGGLIAVMLILIIFLCGIITLLGILNIRLFRELKLKQNSDLSISFSVSESVAAETITEQISEAIAETTPEQASIQLQDSQLSIDTVPQEGALSLQEIYVQNIDSVVSISCTLPGGTSTGTGVIFSASGYIVTNAHVIENSISISVQLGDDRVFPARIIGTDQVTDLAVIRVDASGLTPAKFGDSASLRVGDTVVAIGDPLGVEFRGTYTDGIVSAINRDVEVNGRTMTLIQTNAALNSGNSGGPLINCYGQVIGINTMKIGTFTSRSGVEGLGFAIPSATVKEVVDQLISQGYVSGRPDIGLEGDALSSFYQYYYRLPAGLYVTSVDRGSDAYVKGIQQGDIIISLDNNRITTMEEMNAYLFGCQVGQTITAVVYSDGQQHRVELTLHENRG